MGEMEARHSTSSSGDGVACAKMGLEVANVLGGLAGDGGDGSSPGGELDGGTGESGRAELAGAGSGSSNMATISCSSAVDSRASCCGVRGRLGGAGATGRGAMWRTVARLAGDRNATRGAGAACGSTRRLLPLRMDLRRGRAGGGGAAGAGGWFSASSFPLLLRLRANRRARRDKGAARTRGTGSSGGSGGSGTGAGTSSVEKSKAARGRGGSGRPWRERRRE
mgnify:CR=1 FL=1